MSMNVTVVVTVLMVVVAAARVTTAVVVVTASLRFHHGSDANCPPRDDNCPGSLARAVVVESGREARPPAGLPGRSGEDRVVSFGPFDLRMPVHEHRAQQGP